MKKKGKMFFFCFFLPKGTRENPLSCIFLRRGKAGIGCVGIFAHSGFNFLFF